MRSIFITVTIPAPTEFYLHTYTFFICFHNNNSARITITGGYVVSIMCPWWTKKNISVVIAAVVGDNHIRACFLLIVDQKQSIHNGLDIMYHYSLFAWHIFPTAVGVCCGASIPHCQQTQSICRRGPTVYLEQPGAIAIRRPFIIYLWCIFKL